MQIWRKENVVQKMPDTLLQASDEAKNM